jgi:hypothetical protein
MWFIWCNSRTTTSVAAVKLPATKKCTNSQPCPAVDEHSLTLQSTVTTDLPFNIKTTLHFVGFEVFTAVVMKSIIFWDMTPCRHEAQNTGWLRWFMIA